MNRKITKANKIIEEHPKASIIFTDRGLPVCAKLDKKIIKI